jgi:hypothetical protein
MPEAALRISGEYLFAHDMFFFSPRSLCLPEPFQALSPLHVCVVITRMIREVCADVCCRVLFVWLFPPLLRLSEPL